MQFHKELKALMHQYVKRIYQITRKFPKEEMFGATSQTRRAAMSMILNYIEGFARRRGEYCKVYKNFLETSYGSIKESEYVVYFAYTENWIDSTEYGELSGMSDRIGGMLYGTLEKYR